MKQFTVRYPWAQIIAAVVLIGAFDFVQRVIGFMWRRRR